MNCDATLYEGDCLEELKKIPDSSVDLIFTSPPYAERRKNSYNSISKKSYSEWFLPIAKELKRVLKPTGSFMLNLKADCEDGERSIYVMELVIALKKEIGFSYVDEYIWYKSASPRKKTFRLKNAWEPIYHFSLGKNYINHDKIKIKSIATFANKRGTVSLNSITGNLGGYHEIADQIPGWTDPDNILYFPTALMVRDKYKHPAKFPKDLAGFFVRGFCPNNGIVLDPFAGSGTVIVAALENDCNVIGIEIESKFCEVIKERLKDYRQKTDKSNNLASKEDIFSK